jgi:hypothetical protein
MGTTTITGAPKVVNVAVGYISAVNQRTGPAFPGDYDSHRDDVMQYAMTRNRLDWVLQFGSESSRQTRRLLV